MACISVSSRVSEAFGAFCEALRQIGKQPPTMAKPRAWLLMALLGLSGCQSPFLVFAGGELRATESSTESFAFAAEHKLLTLETRPERPYSVLLRVTVIDDNLYIDAAQKRRWHTFIKADPRVRIKLGKNIYLATAREIEDELIRDRFLSGRTIYRLEPR